MQCPLEARLYLKPQISGIHKETMKNHGLMISMKGISTDPDEIETVRNWIREKKTAN